MILSTWKVFNLDQESHYMKYHITHALRQAPFQHSRAFTRKPVSQVPQSLHESVSAAESSFSFAASYCSTPWSINNLFSMDTEHTAWPHILGFASFGLRSAPCMYPELEKVINCTTQGGQALCFFLFQLELPHTNARFFHYFPPSTTSLPLIWSWVSPLLLLRPCKAEVLVPDWHGVSPWNQSPYAAASVAAMLTCEMHDYAKQAVYLGLQSISRCPVRFVLKRAAAGGFALWSGQWLRGTASRTVSAR